MMWVMLLLPVVLLILGVPIFVILAGTSAVVLFFGDIPGAIVHQNMFSGISIFSLLAVPFFIFAGELMGRGGMSEADHGHCRFWVVCEAAFRLLSLSTVLRRFPLERPCRCSRPAHIRHFETRGIRRSSPVEL